MTPKRFRRKFSSSSLQKKSSNKIDDFCVESKVKCCDEDITVAPPSPGRTLRRRFSFISPRRQKRKSASKELKAATEEAFQEALSRRSLPKFLSHEHTEEEGERAEKLKEFVRRRLREEWQYAFRSHWCSTAAPGVTKYQEEVTTAYTSFAIQAVGRGLILVLQGSLVVVVGFNLSMLTTVLRSDRLCYAARTVYGACSFLSPYVLCKLSEAQGDVKQKSLALSAAYLIFGITLHAFYHESTFMEPLLFPLLLSTLHVIFSGIFHVELRQLGVVTAILVCFSALADDPFFGEPVSTLWLTTFAIVFSYQLERASKLAFCFVFREYLKKEIGSAARYDSNSGVLTTDNKEVFQDATSESSSDSPSFYESSVYDLRSKSCSHVNRGEDESLAELHNALRKLKANVAQNNYIDMESTISSALRIVEDLETPEGSVLKTYRKCLGVSAGVVDSFLETEIGGGRLETAIALESGAWSQDSCLARKHENGVRKTTRRFSYLQKSSSATGFTDKSGQASFAGSLLGLNRSQGEKLGSSTLKVRMNSLQQLLLDWNFGEGGIFARLEDTSNVLPPGFHSSPLAVSTIAAMTLFGVLDNLKLDETAAWNLLEEIERQYISSEKVPYHNSLHACDVLQSVTYFVHKGDLLEELPNVALLALLFGAAAHDVGHPGTNNSFHVNTMSDLAITYSDRSVLEHYHLSLAFKALRKPNCDIIKKLSKSEAKVFRELVIEMVLGTDLANHYANLASFKSSVVTNPDAFSESAPLMSTNSSIKCKALLHCADIGSVAKDWTVYKRWIELLFEEFYKQGDTERSLGLVTASFMDRGISSPAKAQQGFIKCIAMEMFSAVCKWLPELKPTLIDNTKTNLKHLADMKTAEQQERDDKKKIYGTQ